MSEYRLFRVIRTDEQKYFDIEYVRDVVMCKECIWRDKDNQGEDYCTYVKGLADINESSFCSYGESDDGI